MKRVVLVMILVSVIILGNGCVVVPVRGPRVHPHPVIVHPCPVVIVR
jgi:hypothetical protein